MINPHAFFNVIDCQGTRGTSLRNAATARGSTRGGLTAEHLLACFSAMHRKQEGMPASTSGKVFSLWPMSLLECERLVHLLDVDGDGKVSRKDFIAALGRNAGGGNNNTTTAFFHDPFQRLRDVLYDQRMTVSDFILALDTNRDGAVDVDEWVRETSIYYT
jgi:hypothetical protein